MRCHPPFSSPERNDDYMGTVRPGVHDQWFQAPSLGLAKTRRVQLTFGVLSAGVRSWLSKHRSPSASASAIVSFAETSNIRLPGGTGPCRRVMDTRPPIRT